MNRVSAFKQSALSSVASLLALTIIFALTSHKHYGQVDIEYYKSLVIELLAISLIPAMVTLAVKSTKWYWSVVIGVFTGFLSAVAYVQLFKNI